MVFHLSEVGPIADIKQNVKEVKAHVAKFSKPDLYLAIRTLVITAVLYAGFYAGFPYYSKNWALWSLAVFMRAGLNVRIFIIFHDCCHGNFFKSSLANMLVGRLTGSLQFTSWTGWGKVHNTDHHIHYGKDDHALVEWGATVIWTKQEWDSYSLPRKIFLRIAKDPVLFFAFIPPFIFLLTGVHNNKMPMIDWMVPSQPKFSFTPMAPIDRVLPTLFPALQACTLSPCLKTQKKLLMIYAGYAMFGKSYLWFELAFNTLGSIFGFILFHWQHYANVPNMYFGIPKDEHERDLASLMGSTFQYVPEWYKWATFGIEYHHIHHFSTKVPSYQLRPCHDTAPPGMWRYIKYLDFKTELQSLLLVMWNPEKHRFESFPELNWLLGFKDTDTPAVSLKIAKEE
ncbi:hypothetical protein WJX75_004908 [Coccomyxa subellipsoidea]|uniref:Fatty acid desaturase domain-containing protein n=1 Tax=Coccomyxa subellipsoidea TaxID=248742 RepID=A0ABR2YYZ4_9CHLO